MIKYMIETRNLTKKFKKSTVLDKVNIHVRENTIYGLLGPNGAGKSTFLKILTGILQPTAGTLSIGGEPWQREHLSNMGSLIEQPAIYDNLTAYENLQIVTNLLQLPETRIDEVLGIVNLTQTEKKKAGQFSLGMKQRLGIAMALVNKPRLLILDEPTNGLDPVGIQELRELIRTFPKQGITVILSSHNLTEVEQLVDDIGIISNGKLGYESENNKNENLEKLFMEIVKKNEWREL